MTKIAKYVLKYSSMSGIRWSMPTSESESVTDDTAEAAEAAAGQLIRWCNQSPGLQSIAQEVTNQVNLLQHAKLMLAPSREQLNAMSALHKWIEYLHRMPRTDMDAVWSQVGLIVHGQLSETTSSGQLSDN